MFGVLGGHQIPKDAEIANAYLVRKPSGIYLHVVCYVAKDKYKFIWEHPVTKHGKIKKGNGKTSRCRLQTKWHSAIKRNETSAKDRRNIEIEKTTKKTCQTKMR